MSVRSGESRRRFENPRSTNQQTGRPPISRRLDADRTVSRRCTLHRQYPTEHIIRRPPQPDRTTELIPQDSKTPVHISQPAIPAAPSLPRMATPASIDSTGLRSTPTITVTRHGLSTNTAPSTSDDKATTSDLRFRTQITTYDTTQHAIPPIANYNTSTLYRYTNYHRVSQISIDVCSAHILRVYHQEHIVTVKLRGEHHPLTDAHNVGTETRRWGKRTYLTSLSSRICMLTIPCRAAGQCDAPKS